MRLVRHGLREPPRRATNELFRCHRIPRPPSAAGRQLRLSKRQCRLRENQQRRADFQLRDGRHPASIGSAPEYKPPAVALFGVMERARRPAGGPARGLAAVSRSNQAPCGRRASQCRRVRMRSACVISYSTTRNPRCVAAGVTSTWVRSRLIAESRVANRACRHRAGRGSRARGSHRPGQAGVPAA